MSGWIRLEVKEHNEGQKLTISAAPEVGIADQQYFFRAQDEADEAKLKALIYAEKLMNEGRVSTIFVDGELYAAPEPANP